MLCGRGGVCPARGFAATRNLRANRVYGFPPPKGKAFAAPRNICKNLRKKSRLDILRVDDILLLYEIELLENEQFRIKQCIATQKSTEKQVIPNV